MKKKSNDCPSPKGCLFIIGGKEEKSADENLSPQDRKGHMEILERLLKSASNANPRIEIITSASKEGEASFDEYRKAFEVFDVRQVAHIHHTSRQQVMEEHFAERLNQADIIFFPGGDQLLLTSLYGGSQILLRMKERYIAEDIIIAGTSAGAMAMSTPMIYAGSKEVQEVAGAVKITTGLEFLKDVCIDTHFIDRSRFVRMAQVIATNPTAIGIGIEEDTAIIVHGGTEAEVIGSGLITIIEGNKIES